MARETKPDMVKVWFFCLIPVLIVAVGVLVHVLTNDVSITLN